MNRERPSRDGPVSVQDTEPLASTGDALAHPANQVPPRSDDTHASSSQPAPIAIMRSVEKSYHLDAVEVPVIRGVDLLIRPGHFTVLLGPSGSGKTTLLNMLGCIDRPDKGEVTVAGCDVNQLSDDELADFRSKNIGFVFQSFNLLPVLTVYENVEYPLLLTRASASKRADRVPKLLDAVGLADKARNLPGQLSGGQRQRVAIARALAARPKLVIADEPTANLDSVTGKSILKLMRHMQRRYNISFIFSSHDRRVIAEADDTIFIQDGMIRSVRRKGSAVS
jgi:putative ABC transport system ATP-binding protein